MHHTCTAPGCNRETGGQIVGHTDPLCAPHLTSEADHLLAAGQHFRIERADHMHLVDAGSRLALMRWLLAVFDRIVRFLVDGYAKPIDRQ